MASLCHFISWIAAATSYCATSPLTLKPVEKASADAARHCIRKTRSLDMIDEVRHSNPMVPDLADLDTEVEVR